MKPPSDSPNFSYDLDVDGPAMPVRASARPLDAPAPAAALRARSFEAPVPVAPYSARRIQARIERARQARLAARRDTSPVMETTVIVAPVRRSRWRGQAAGWVSVVMAFVLGAGVAWLARDGDASAREPRTATKHTVERVLVLAPEEARLEPLSPPLPSSSPSVKVRSVRLARKRSVVGAARIAPEPRRARAHVTIGPEDIAAADAADALARAQLERSL